MMLLVAYSHKASIKSCVVTELFSESVFEILVKHLRIHDFMYIFYVKYVHFKYSLDLQFLL